MNRISVIPQYKLKKSLLYIIYALISAILGVLLLTTPYFLPFALVVGLLIFILTLKYPFMGLVGYLAVIFLRPGETLGIPYATKLVAGFCLLVWIINAAQEKKIAPLTRLNSMMLLFFVAITLSVVTAYWFTAFFEAWQWAVRLLILYILIVNLVDTPERFKALGIVILVLTGYVCILGIREYFLKGGPSGNFRTTGVTGGMFESGNDFAQILDMYIPFTIALFFYVKKFWLKLVWLGLTVMAVAVNVMTFSRGGFLGLIAVLGFIFFRSDRKIVILPFLLSLLILFIIFAPASYMNRMKSISSYNQDESSQGRIDAWKTGMRMFAASPLTGIGVGCFYGAYLRYGIGIDRVAHNSFITALAELGIVGTIPFLLLIFFSFQASYRVAKYLRQINRTDSFLYLIANTLPISLVGYIVTAIFLTSLYYPSLYILFGFFSALQIIVLEKKLVPPGNPVTLAKTA